MIHYIYIRCKARDKNKILLKFYKNQINLYDIRENKEYLYLKIKEEDFKNVKKKIVVSKFYYIDDSGIFHLKRVLTPLKIVMILLFLVSVNFFSQIVLSVSVIHENKAVRELVAKAIEEKGIKSFSFKKNYQELQEIKKEVLNTYKDTLEWLEIESVGMKYIVRVEERIINKEESSNKFCHIVATKSGIINKVIAKEGEVLVNDGQYVSEGDVLISGEIKYNEEVKNNVCAKGSVLAEVWYQSSVSIPKIYEEKVKTGKKRINFSIGLPSGHYKIFRSRLSQSITEEKELFRFFDFNFYKLKEYEVNLESRAISLEEAEEIALEKSSDAIKAKLKENEKILMQKVLKKNINDSTIDIEIFYAVLEMIGTEEEYFVAEEEG